MSALREKNMFYEHVSPLYFRLQSYKGQYWPLKAASILQYAPLHVLISLLQIFKSDFCCGKIAHTNFSLPLLTWTELLLRAMFHSVPVDCAQIRCPFCLALELIHLNPILCFCEWVIRSRRSLRIFIGYFKIFQVFFCKAQSASSASTSSALPALACLRGSCGCRSSDCPKSRLRLMDIICTILYNSIQLYTILYNFIQFRTILYMHIWIGNLEFAGLWAFEHRN